jgi:hypothetical protein
VSTFVIRVRCENFGNGKGSSALRPHILIEFPLRRIVLESKLVGTQLAHPTLPFRSSAHAPGLRPPLPPPRGSFACALTPRSAPHDKVSPPLSPLPLQHPSVTPLIVPFPSFEALGCEFLL